MARTAQPGISYYPQDVTTVMHPKIKLLYNEFDSHGPWVYNCILSEIYKVKGYFFDASDIDSFTLFATDVCKKQVSLVNEIVKACVKRGLFNKSVFDATAILTSDRIQENYIEATSERRRKGTTIEIRSDLLLIPVDENWQNVLIKGSEPIVPGINSILPWNNPIDPRHGTQSKVKESKVKESKGESGENSPSHPAFLEFIYKKNKPDFTKLFPAEHQKHVSYWRKFTEELKRWEEEQKWKFRNQPTDLKSVDEDVLQKIAKKQEEQDKSEEKILRAEIEKFRKYYAAQYWKLKGGLKISEENCIDVFGRWMDKKAEWKVTKT